MGRIKNLNIPNSIDDGYTKSSRKHVTLNLEKETINYYKELSAESGLPFQAIISLYLNECRDKKLKPNLSKY